jgi:hypothetical protein
MEGRHNFAIISWRGRKLRSDWAQRSRTSTTQHCHFGAGVSRNPESIHPATRCMDSGYGLWLFRNNGAWWKSGDTALESRLRKGSCHRFYSAYAVSVLRQMFFEERHRAFPGLLCRRFVVAARRVIVEAVARARIGVHFVGHLVRF